MELSGMAMVTTTAKIEMTICVFGVFLISENFRPPRKCIEELHSLFVYIRSTILNESD